MRLTPLGRKALEQALREGELRRVFDGKPGRPPWPAPAPTLAALVRNGLMSCGERLNRKQQLMVVWGITDEGREVLDTWTLTPKGFLVPPRHHRDTILSMRSNGSAQSRVMVGGVWKHVSLPEPEKVDVRRLDPVWVREARERYEQDRPTGRRAA